jgi:hypothetical protein
MHLPDKHNKWTWGMSLALYSKPYKETNGLQINTPQGEMINRYKYLSGVSVVRREEIVKTFSDQVFDLVKKELNEKYPDPKQPPFDICLGLPENRDTGNSLPREICKSLSKEHDWLKDGFACVMKTRAGVVVKTIPKEDRPGIVRGLYTINHAHLPPPTRGFLIVDDVFETGSSVGALCDTLEQEFPHLPRFVVALTHLHATERM